MNWTIAGVHVPGPDRIAYTELATLGLDLEGRAVRQGMLALDWSYTTVLADEMTLLQSMYFANENKRVAVTWYDAYDGWKTGDWTMNEPTIGKRQTYNYMSVAIRFTPIYRSESVGGLPILAFAGSPMTRFISSVISPASIGGQSRFGQTVVDGPYTPTDIRPAAIVGQHAIGTASVG